MMFGDGVPPACLQYLYSFPPPPPCARTPSFLDHTVIIGPYSLPLRLLYGSVCGCPHGFVCLFAARSASCNVNHPRRPDKDAPVDAWGRGFHLSEASIKTLGDDFGAEHPADLMMLEHDDLNDVTPPAQQVRSDALVPLFVTLFCCYFRMQFIFFSFPWAILCTMLSWTYRTCVFAHAGGFHWCTLPEHVSL